MSENMSPADTNMVFPPVEDQKSYFFLGIPWIKMGHESDYINFCLMLSLY